MKYMSLKNMTEEEKKARKRKQKNEASKRYYQKNKNYYKNYVREWSKQRQEKLYKQLEAYENMRKEAIEFLKEYHNYENRFKWCEQDYIDTIEELENILNKVGDSNE